MGMAFRRRLFVVAALLAAPPLAHAQLDYRNLDDDRPALIEDAYPVERFAFEILAPWRYARARGAGGVHSFLPELEYGLFGNLHLGLKLPIARAETASGAEWGVSGLRVFGLYNFNTESRWLPALALRADAVLPVGSLAGEGTRVTAKAIATRSWGQSRIHVNAAYTFGADRPLAAADPANKWWLGGAVDRTLFRQSALLIAEVYALRPAASEPVELNASFGLRYQWTPMMVFDLGVARRLRETGPDYEITLGISRAFALAGLLPRGP
jgi:hypothetical protein